MRLLFTLTLLALSGKLFAFEILASIHPLALIAREIAPADANVGTLLPAGLSPHDYQLRPSDRQRLSAADLVIWNGPALEPYLKASLGMREAGSVITLSPEDHHDEHQAVPAAHDEHHHEHEHGAGELHPWLDPVEAGKMAERIAQRLIAFEPDWKAEIDRNLGLFQAELGALEASLEKRLSAVRGRGYIVFHDAFTAFEQRFGLNKVAAVTLSPERTPGPRQIALLREKIASGEALCIFAEPQFPSRRMKILAEGLAVRSGQLDPLGSKAERYPQMLTQIADSIVQCLENAEP